MDEEIYILGVGGSSPLARGLPVDLDLVGGAGDHPRSRGVYVEEAGGASIADGSSPLARGLLAHRQA